MASCLASNPWLLVEKLWVGVCGCVCCLCVYMCVCVCGWAVCGCTCVCVFSHLLKYKFQLSLPWGITSRLYQQVGSVHSYSFLRPNETPRWIFPPWAIFPQSLFEENNLFFKEENNLGFKKFGFLVLTMNTKMFSKLSLLRMLK